LLLVAMSAVPFRNQVSETGRHQIGELLRFT